VESGVDGAIADNSAVSSAGEVTVLVPLADLVDPERERDRLERRLRKTVKEFDSVDQKLANPGFVERAPEAVVDRERARRAELEQVRQRLEEALARLG
jgi:valyl-tRNA synthetase